MQIMKRKYIIALGSLLSILLTAFSAWLNNKQIALPVSQPKPTQATVVATVSPTATHGTEYAKVVAVVDGDTIKIEGGELVRYIGMNTPETVAPGRPVECFGKEASNKNKELVLGKTVMLEKDVSNRDRYGRLLRYVWDGDTMINEKLVKEGYAQVSTYPPDVKYEETFIQAQREARHNNSGLWGAHCVLPTVEPDLKPTAIASPSTPVPTPTFVCDCTKSCERMSCSEAQFMLKACGCTNRDANNDGVACETQCH